MRYHLCNNAPKEKNNCECMPHDSVLQELFAAVKQRRTIQDNRYTQKRLAVTIAQWAVADP
jgi:hypothetical protein